MVPLQTVGGDDKKHGPRYEASHPSPIVPSSPPDREEPEKDDDPKKDDDPDKDKDEDEEDDDEDDDEDEEDDENPHDSDPPSDEGFDENAPFLLSLRSGASSEMHGVTFYVGGVFLYDDVAEVKKKIHNSWGFEPEMQRLMLHMNNNKKLSDLGFKRNHIVNFFMTNMTDKQVHTQVGLRSAAGGNYKKDDDKEDPDEEEEDEEDAAFLRLLDEDYEEGSDDDAASLRLLGRKSVKLGNRLSLLGRRTAKLGNYLNLINERIAVLEARKLATPRLSSVSPDGVGGGGSASAAEVTTTLSQQPFKTAQQFRQGLANAIASDMSASAAAAVDRKPQTTKPQTTKPQTKK